MDTSAQAVLPVPFSRQAAAGVSGLPHVPEGTVFLTYRPEFESILGHEPVLRQLAEEDWECFHEAGIYDARRQSIIVTSNRIAVDKNGQSPQEQQQKITVTEIPLGEPEKRRQLTAEEHNIVMANGGTNYRSGYLLCDQGYGADRPSALVWVHPPSDPAASTGFRSEVILNNYHGRPFNSLNDVVVHSDGSIWFTDPDCELRSGPLRNPWQSLGGAK